MNKINILIVIRWPVGGIRTFCRYVYNNFDKKKFKFTILAPAVKELDNLLDDLKDYEVQTIKTSFAGDMAYLSYSTITSTIIKGRYDIIHSHGLSAGIYCSLPAKIKRVPHIMTVHGVFNNKEFTGFSGIIKKLTFSILIPLINCIHHVSCDARDNFFQYIPITKLFRKKNIVILNGINIDQFVDAKPRNYYKEFNLHDNIFIIGYMGRFMPEKGFTYIVDAVELLIKKYKITNIKVICFGWGGYIREEQENIKIKGLDNFFIFLPFTPNVASSLKGFDVLAIPSLQEACPLLPMEAMVAGIPIIGSNCIGLKEVLKVNKESTRIIPPKNSIKLAESLILEMNNSLKNKSENFKKNAAVLFNVRKQAAKIEKTILNLL